MMTCLLDVSYATLLLDCMTLKMILRQKTFKFVRQREKDSFQQEIVDADLSMFDLVTKLHILQVAVLSWCAGRTASITVCK